MPLNVTPRMPLCRRGWRKRPPEFQKRPNREQRTEIEMRVELLDRIQRKLDRSQRQPDLRAERGRSPERLVGDRYQYRGQQVSARNAGNARARERSARIGDSCG